jgi:oxazoline/thiazoline dehydrogenase
VIRGGTREGALSCCNFIPSPEEGVEASWLISLAEGVTASPGEVEELVLANPQSRLTLRRLSAGCLEALRQLGAGGQTVGALADQVRYSDGPGSLARLFYHLEELARRGWLLISAHAEGELLATLVSIADSFSLPTGPLPARPHLLSRFCCLRRRGGEFILESPLSPMRIIVHDGRAAAMIQALVKPTTAAEFAATAPSLHADAVGPLLTLLARSGMAVAVDEEGKTLEDTDPVLLSWEFHDLLFHSRSRVGRHDASVGALFPMVGRIPQPPAVKPPAGVETIGLYRPDLEQLARQDPPFVQVQEERRSIRDYAAEPITARQLGEFLFRVARVKDCFAREMPTPHGPVLMEFTSRPYPGGGSLYELEVYPIVNTCQGLPSGLYHYDAALHRLERLAGRTAEVELLLLDMSQATGIATDHLQVVLAVTARFPRLTWKYSMLAYSLTLKHVGVLYQTMYLAATAMRLAPCGVGAGDSDLFARAAGVDYYAEPAVGEFLLGSRKEGD